MCGHEITRQGHKINKGKQDEILEVSRKEQLCANKINHAETYWIRTIQANSFSSEGPLLHVLLCD